MPTAAGRRVPWWRPVLIVTLGLATTALLASALARATRLEDQVHFDRAVERSRTAIAARIQAYIAMLRGGAALFAGTGDVTEAGFRAYVNRLAIASAYPGIQGIGFTQRVPAAALDRFVAGRRAHDRPGFHVWPGGPRPEYHAIVFLEPLDRRNLAAIGYDMSTEPVRRAAMERARDTGEPAASRPVTLVQEIDPDKQVGFLIYVPVYAGLHVPTSFEARREALVGYVYAPFRVADLFRGIFGPGDDPQVGFEAIARDEAGARTVLHRTGAPVDAPRFTGQRDLEVAGERWSLAFWSQPGLERAADRSVLGVLVACGVALSLLLAWLDTLGARERRSAQQVTEYRHAVRHGERLHQLAVDHVADHAIFHVDAAGRLASWNRGVERLFGWRSEEFVGRPYGDMFPPDDPGEPRAPGPAGPPLGHEVSSAERWCRGKGGARLRITVTVTSLADEQERFAGWLVVMRDVTERALEDERRRQLLGAERAARREAERVGRMKDEFLATLSHELRTPLNAILGWAQVLARDPSNLDQVRRGLDVITRNARAQAQIVEDLLDMSRIVSGKIRLEPEPVDVGAVVDAALDVVRPMAAARGVALGKSAPPSMPQVIADSRRLQQVLWNLLTNAVKFTPRGGRVHVAVEPAGQALSIAVTDTGQGIAPEFLPHVFEPFRQADASMTRRHGGLGLGLAIVRSVVELHGGSVSAASPGPGAGATFTVALPLAPAVAAGPADAAGDVAPVKGRLRGRTVLVVDDAPDGRELARVALEQAGARVEVAGSASEALDMVVRGAPRFDAVISDLAMPVADGHDFVRGVRRSAGDDRRVPAIALTAMAGDDHREAALASGFDAFLTKPLDPTALVDVLDALARGR